jgi:predicted Zn-dependent peptidase
MEPAVEMLLRVIDDGMATRLYHELCDKRGLCYSVSGTYEAYDDTGLVELEADAAHARAPLVLEQMMRVTEELCAAQILDAEFERTQKRTRWQHDAYADETAATAEFFALSELTGSVHSPADRLAQLLSVTKEDIRTAAESVFSAQGRNVVCVGRADRAAMEKIAHQASR